MPEGTQQKHRTNRIFKSLHGPLTYLGVERTIFYYKDASVLQAKLLQHCTLKIYAGFSHGMMTTHADVINADILAFVKGEAVKAA
jgi:hypothetical protein